MGIWDKLTSGVQKHLDKKREEREWMEGLQREAQAHEKIIFEKQFKEDALKVAQSKAKKDAAKLSGLQKLRALNRARRLTEPGQGDTLFSKISQFTQKNIKNREENLKRTEELRQAATKMRKDDMKERVTTRDNNITRRKPFGQSNWKM